MRVLKFIRATSGPYQSYLWGMVVAICIISIDANIKPYLIKLLIDAAAQPGSANVAMLIGVYAVSQGALIAAWIFSDWCAIRFNTHYRASLTTTLANKLSHYSYSFFQSHLSGSIAAKMNDIFTLAPGLIFTITHQFLQFSLTALITLILLAQVHIFFALGLFCWINLFLVITYRKMKKVTLLTTIAAESKNRIWGHLSDYLTNMVNVRLFAAAGFELKGLSNVLQDFVQKSQAQGTFLMRFYRLQGVFVSFYSVSFLLGLLYLQRQELITVGDFALVFMLNFNIFEKLYDLAYQLREFVGNWGTVEQALFLFEAVPEIQDHPHAKPLQIHHGEISFDKVKFHYKGTTPLFQDKSIHITGGEKIGLVWYSGGSKTTFFHLILRLYDVTSGHILIDGQDIQHVTQDSLHKAISMIPQDPALFHRTIRENIRYGRFEATDAEVIAAAKRAHAHDFIITLPQGYQALVGERGVKLSGGQRRRIAIARAILKNAPILILDEATSQLDSVTERVIQESLANLMQGKTTLVVAHRLSTLLHMDRILVFEQGKIIEDGPYQALLAKGGVYKALWEAQVGGFLPDQQQEA